MGRKTTGTWWGRAARWCCLLLFATVLAAPAGFPAAARRNRTPAASPKTPAAPKAEIASLGFFLPREAAWTRNPDAALAAAGVSEWVVEGYTPKTTPARVVYQKVSPPQDTAVLKALIMQPLVVCSDTQMSSFTGTSKYHNQMNIETICSRAGRENYGLQTFVSIFSDAAANHVIIAEIRTPPSDRAGVLDGSDPAIRRQAEISRTLSAALFRLVQNIRVCDEKNLCI